ncbi:unnamed protein product [Orchesella dallaii]|uniref:EGF-like domain-containing protein n=1 Tax=Orchesella dallaii TaxID=48710 RepID=A0ABP1R078_9HEXA
MWKRIYHTSAFLMLLYSGTAHQTNAEEASTETVIANEYASCTDTNQCNLSEGFICSDGFCKCAYDTLKFDSETKKCVQRKVGDQCGFFIGSANATMVPCPENSMCVWDNDAFKASYQYVEKHCICISGHYKDDVGNCVPYAKFGEMCNEKRKCDSSESDLVCSSASSTCECPFGIDQYYDRELRKCISFVGANCTMYCVDNAFCENYGPDLNVNPKRWAVQESSREYVMRESICQCRPGYESSPDRRCQLIPPGYNSPCYGEEEQCDSRRNLQCIDKICQCKNPLHQTYSYELGRCMSYVDDMCSPEIDGICVPNAKCTKDEASEKHFCRCDVGYSRTPSRKCMKDYGQSCHNEFCNVFSGLACVNKTCQCYDSFLKYDAELKACVSTMNGPCGKVYLPMELEMNFALNVHVPSISATHNRFMNMKAMCVECDGYHISCPKGSVCTSENDVLMVIRGKEKQRCRVTAT